MKNVEKMGPDHIYYVEYSVLKNFIAVLKKNKIYHYFRCTVGYETSNPITHLYGQSFDGIRRLSVRENPFKSCEDYMDVLTTMVGQCHGRKGSTFCGDKDKSQELQMHISACINILLHLFVERHIHDFEFLSKIGGEIFEATCKEVIGNDFVDLTEPSPEELAKLKQIHDIVSSGNIRNVSPETIEGIRNFMNSLSSRVNLDHPNHNEPPFWDCLDEEDCELEDFEYDEETPF